MPTTQTPDKVALYKTATAPQSITPNAHERSEWMRCAQDASARGFGDTSARFTTASLCAVLPLTDFDALQTEYRQWLIRGFAVQIAAQASL